MLRRPLQLGQLGALYWLCSSGGLVTCESQRPHAEASAAPPAAGDQLKLVQAVFRHGARTPLTDKFWQETGARFETGTVCGDLLPQRPAISIRNAADGGPRPLAKHDAVQAARVLPGGCTKGELTLLGQRQAIDTGAWLRQRYVDQLGFLPQAATAGAVSGRTTNYRRTVNTLEYVVAGLYQSSDAAIPVVTASELDEILFGNAKACEQLARLMSTQRRALKESLADSDDIRQLELRVHEAMGTKPEDGHVSFVELHDALTTLRTHQKPLPGTFDTALLDDIEREAARRMLALVAPDEAIGGKPGALRLGVGRLVAEIVQRMKASTSGDAEYKLYLYSGHDTTIMPLLRALGTAVDHWPGYLSNLVFELWERPSETAGAAPRHIVRVLYNRQVLHFPGTKEDGTIELPALFGGHALDTAQQKDLCKIQLEHDGSMPKAAESGDAVQGL